MERYGDDDNPALVAETENYRVHQVRWPVLDGVFGEGLLVRPKRQPIGHVVVIPDAGLSPENTLEVAAQLAENGHYYEFVAANEILWTDARNAAACASTSDTSSLALSFSRSTPR